MCPRGRGRCGHGCRPLRQLPSRHDREIAPALRAGGNSTDGAIRGANPARTTIRANGNDGHYLSGSEGCNATRVPLRFSISGRVRCTKRNSECPNRRLPMKWTSRCRNFSRASTAHELIRHLDDSQKSLNQASDLCLSGRENATGRPGRLVSSCPWAAGVFH